MEMTVLGNSENLENGYNKKNLRLVKIKYLCRKCQYVEYIGSFNRIYYIILI